VSEVLIGAAGWLGAETLLVYEAFDQLSSVPIDSPLRIFWMLGLSTMILDQLVSCHKLINLLFAVVAVWPSG
jgi:hypothetical protein